MLKALQLVLLFTTFAHAAVPLSSFDTVLGLQRDGSVVVVEKFIPATPQQRITWFASTEYAPQWGIRNPRMVEILQVTTTEGVPLRYQVRYPLGRLQLTIESGGAREIRLVYSVRNAVRFMQDHDELFWIVGESWRGSTAKASFFVQVPPELANTARIQAYIRGRGLLSVRPTEAGPDRVWFECGPVQPNEQVLVDVVLPKGELTEPSLGKRIGWFVSANTIVLLPFAVLVVMLTLRSLKRLPEKPDYTVVANYEPPSGMTPAEAGVLIDDSFDPRDVTATFIDLAIRRVIRLEPCQPDEGVHFQRNDFRVTCLLPRDEWTSLALHERTLLFHSFYGGEWTKLSSLTFRFPAIVPTMRRNVVQVLRAKGMYWTDPGHSQSARMALLLTALGVCFFIQLVGIFSFASSWLLSILSVGISAAIVYYFGRGLTSKTMKGLRAYEQVLGFQHYLDMVESDRLERLPAELFEKWLPYAMALGVEHHWARNFEGVAVPQIEWASGLEHAIFDEHGLLRTLAEIARETAGSSARRV